MIARPIDIEGIGLSSTQAEELDIKLRRGPDKARLEDIVRELPFAAFDGHTHSVFSDGSFTPLEIARTFVTYGGVLVGSGDHDTQAGLQYAQRQVDLGKEPVEILDVMLPVVEFSLDFKGKEIHVLGYGKDPNDTSRDAGTLSDLMRNNTHYKAQARLQELDMINEYWSKNDPTFVPATRDFVQQETSLAGYIGRNNIAYALALQNGGENRITTTESFNRFVNPFRYKKDWVENRQDVRDFAPVAKRSGLTSMLAHPFRYGLEFSDIVELFRILDGGEIYYPDHSEDQVKALRRELSEGKKLIVGGSDWHGRVRKGAFGVEIPVKGSGEFLTVYHRDLQPFFRATEGKTLGDFYRGSVRPTSSASLNTLPSLALH